MIKEKKTPGLAASNMTGTGPGGLSAREFARQNITVKQFCRHMAGPAVEVPSAQPAGG